MLNLASMPKAHIPIVAHPVTHCAWCWHARHPTLSTNSRTILRKVRSFRDRVRSLRRSGSVALVEVQGPRELLLVLHRAER
jgi:hypothetical protein